MAIYRSTTTRTQGTKTPAQKKVQEDRAKLRYNADSVKPGNRKARKSSTRK